MPFGNTGNLGEEFILSQKGSKNKSLARNALAKYLADTQREQNIESRSFLEARDPNVFNPPSNNVVVRTGGMRGGLGKPQYTSVDPNSIRHDWETVKDISSFAKDNPQAFLESAYLGAIQSPIKLIGRLGEATWARGNDNYQNELSDKALTNIETQDAEAWRRAHAGEAGKGSYNDRMKRVGAFQARQNLVEAMRPEFTSDTTFGDVADVASWVVPGPEGLVNAGIKGARFGIKGARAAKLAAEMAAMSPRVTRGLETATSVGAMAGPRSGLVSGIASALSPNTTENRTLKIGSEVFDDPEIARENAYIDDLSRSTEQMAEKQGIPLSDINKKMRERATGTIWDTHTYNPENGTYTINLTGQELDRDAIKMAAYNTLVGGKERQAKYGHTVDEIPDSWQDIPDEFVDRILSDYHGHHRVVDTSGRSMPHYGLTLDHGKSLKSGGSNTLDNLFPMKGKTNFSKGG